MSSSNKAKSINGNTDFVKSVAKYFMDFLETDFHKRKNPKRSVKLRSPDNLLVGINLNKYQSFADDVWDLINNSFEKGKLKTIEKGVYKTDLPQNLIDLVKLQVNKISKDDINNIISEISEELEKEAVVYKKEYDKAFSVSLESSIVIIKNSLVLPFIGSIEKPIENLNIGDENDIFLMEEELTDVLSKLIENKISEILKSLIAEEKINIIKELKSVFDLDIVKVSILNFFEDFKVGDLFNEIFEINKNKSILDKQEFYLYFCDITFNKSKYPIFYVPFEIKITDDSVAIDFDSQLYINKRALDFIVQEFNVKNNLKGSLKTITDRIIYLSQHTNDLPGLLSQIVSELTNFFKLDASINLKSAKPQSSKSLSVRVSNSAYISLFDKSDEALINDYEVIIQELDAEGALAMVFNELIDNFIHKNPEPVGPEVENEWDNLGVSEKLVATSPIPLNSEQLQILSAINKEKCKYLIVEGPPGTGKSHTITAIAFDAILNHKSVLVLSDKKEALDVVEDKITETMNKVRSPDEKDFQNPILRLGKTGSTYSQILSRASLEKIKDYHRAVHKDYDSLVDSVPKLQESIKQNINAEIEAYKDIDLKQIQEFYNLEKYYDDGEFEFDLNEVSKNQYDLVLLEDLRNFVTSFKSDFEENFLSKFFKISLSKVTDIESLNTTLGFIVSLSEILLDTFNKYETKLDKLVDFGPFLDESLPKLKHLVDKYEKSKSPIIGHLFKKSKLDEINTEFRLSFPFSKYEKIQDSILNIKSVVEVYEYLWAIREHNETLKNIEGDYLKTFVALIADIEQIVQAGDSAKSLKEEADELLEVYNVYPLTLEKLGLKKDNPKSWVENKLVSMSDFEFDRAIKYANLKDSIVGQFNSIPQFNYNLQKKEIETLVTTEVTHLLDSRLIDFYEHNKNDAETLRNIIRGKKQFPKEQFAKLKDAFPCILAGIRDYAEYIPLEPELFDLVIIDEASQVSIAQAFPALIRAKKVLILGDKKQFSNVKALQAKSETNREYLNSLSDVFRRDISSEDSKLVKLAKFDIKTSIMDFFEFISNYHIQLQKHFRGYKEIISYSNKNFYQNSLQVMKIRGKSIDDVLKFTFVEQDGKTELIQNTNKLEIDKIIAELRELRDSNKTPSVGIITPHTNQQKLLIDEISKLPEKDYYFDELNLKIMTFDTCQGEERDIVFYSMVANEESDKLWGVFIKDFNSIDNEEDGKIKAQRLNVGFSRAKECMHFILSKPLDKFTGSIGDALRQYYNTLEESKKEKTAESVDQNSKMEVEVLNWFYQTDFWIKNKAGNNVEFLPQFELGKYLRQLDRTYNHPNYKVDFLLVYRNEKNYENKIVIEYDGFKEHFTNIDEVNELNYARYYSEGDVYREKVLESYGYKFLRINKFNSGENPIKTLDTRINALLKNTKVSNSFLDNVHSTVEGLQNGKKKECPKCNEIRDVNDFKDSSLVSGYGRFCKYCKNKSITTRAERPAPQLTDVSCPRCSSPMILRNGPRGKFYGCSRFPRCRGTRPHR